MKKRILEVGINFIFWGLTGWLIINSFSIVGQEIEIIDGVENISVTRDGKLFRQLTWVLICCIMLFYSNYQGLLNRLKKGEVKWSMIAALTTFLICFLAYFALYHLEFATDSKEQIQESFRLSHIIALGIFIFYFITSTAYALAKMYVQMEQQKKQLVLEKNQAELAMLRSQLHPHFLFNTMNNLLATIDQSTNPVLARSLDQLSSLLRYVVTDIQNEKVAVRKEIEFIQNYVDLHQLRFEDHEVNFELQVYGAFDQQPIEPGIFIPFVENAFKYGVEPEKSSAIKIMFDLRKPDQITFSCKNEVFPDMLQKKGIGSGIQSTKDRLQLVYPHKHKINIYENGSFEVFIELTTI